MSRAWMREPGASFEDALVDGPRLPADVDRALEQHRVLQQQVRALGYDLCVLPPLAGAPDACFVEDRAVVLRGEALMTSSAVTSRASETASLAAALDAELDLVWMEQGTADGGDILRVGSWMFIGRSTRTNDAGCDVVAAFARRHGLRPIVVDVGELHLKCSASSPAPDLLLVAENTPMVSVLPDGLDHLVVPAHESYAANAVGGAGAVLVAAGYPRTAELLSSAGLDVRCVDLSQFSLRDGSMTCLSLLSQAL